MICFLSVFNLKVEANNDKFVNLYLSGILKSVQPSLKDSTMKVNKTVKDTIRINHDPIKASENKNYLDIYHYLPKETRGLLPYAITLNVSKRKYPY
jgi:hypothetical protein